MTRPIDVERDSGDVKSLHESSEARIERHDEDMIVDPFVEDSAFQQCVDLLNRVWPAPSAASIDRSAECRTDAPGASQDESPQSEVKWGRFVLRRQLGQGTYGIVFLAFDRLAKRQVALKIPQGHVLANPKSLKRFLREAEAAAVLDHPGIVPVFEVGELNSVPFIVSAYCPGPNLAEWLAQNHHPVPPQLAVAVVSQIAAAVDYAHSRGVLHRDLKPANVLLSEQVHRVTEETQFSPKITDFGLAKIAGAVATATCDGSLVGTYRYMAPEQACGRVEDIGVQADVWALGAILYEMLAGKPPFAAEDHSVLQAIQETEPAQLSSLGLPIPRDLVNICHRCLQKELSHRYRSAKEVHADLQRFARGEPVSARPLGPAARVARWARRRPVVAGLSIALLFSVLAGFGGVILQWRRANAEAVAATLASRRAATHLAQSQASVRDLAWIVQEFGLYCHPEDRLPYDVTEMMAASLNSGDQLNTDPESQRAMHAAVRMFCANTSAAAGDHLGALPNFVTGISAWREIVGKHPNNPSYRRALALALYCYGVSLDVTGQHAEAQEQFLAARDVAVSQVASNQQQAAELLEYSATVSSIGRSFDIRERSQEALAAYREAAAIANQAIDLDPARTTTCLAAAGAAVQLGKYQLRLPNHQDALTEFERAREFLSTLKASEPDNEAADALLVETEWSTAQTYKRLGAWKNTCKHYVDAISTAESALAHSADKLTWSVRTANLCTEFGLARLDTNERAPAQLLLERASELWEVAHRGKRVTDRQVVQWGVASYELARLYQAQGHVAKRDMHLQRAAELFAATRGTAPNTARSRRAREGCQAMLAQLQLSAPGAQIQPESDPAESEISAVE